MKKLLVILFVSAVCSLGQSAQSGTIEFRYEIAPESARFGDVYRDAARLLMEGFKGALHDAVPALLGGKQLGKNWEVSVLLTPRTRRLQPQHLSVAIRQKAPDTEFREVYSFQLGLEVDLMEQATKAVNAIIKVVAPQGGDKRKAAQAAFLFTFL